MVGNLLGRLPAELRLKIASHLGHFDLRCPRMSCRLACTDYQELDTTELLLEADSDLFAMQNDLWACFECARMRCNRNFVKRSRTGKKGRYNIDVIKRFCIDCGCQPHNVGQPGGALRYRPRTKLVIFKETCIICPRCELVKPCNELDGRLAEVCKDCYAPRGRFEM